MELALKCPRLEAHLRPDERLVWCDRSRDTEVRKHFYRLALTFGAVSLVLAIVLFNMISDALESGFKKEQREILPFAGMEAFFLVLTGTAIRSGWRPYRFWYGLTNRRVLVLGANGGLAAYTGLEFGNTQITLGSGGDNRGTLAFDYGPGGEGEMGFRQALIGIREPARVEALIHGTLLHKDEEGAAI